MEKNIFKLDNEQLKAIARSFKPQIRNRPHKMTQRSKR